VWTGDEMTDLTSFITAELPAFALWLRTGGFIAEADAVLVEHTRRLDADLARIKKQIIEERPAI